MFSRKTLFFATALSLLAAGAKADTTSCVSVDCAALGYTQTASQCSGADTILKCPFDLSKVACNTNNLSLNDFILAKVQQYLPTPCGGNSSDYTSAVDISGCVPQGARLCGILSSDAIFSGLNIAILSCMSKGVTVSTVQDLVDLIISVLNTKTSNTCSNVVEVGDYETCTQYCASDSTKCIAKRSMTCDEAITIAAAGTKLTAQSASSGALDDPLYFLTENVNISYLDSLNQEFREASSLPPCASDSSVLQHPKLVIQLVGYLTGGGFGVDTTILKVGNGMTGTTSIDISNNFLAENLPVFAYNSSAVLSFNISADNSDRDLKVVTGINCTNPTGQTAGCSLRYSSYNYKLQNNTKVTYCSYGSAKIEPTCTGNNITCTQGSDYSCLAPEE